MSVWDSIYRLGRKLDQLRVADPQCRFFGVETHRYRLAPCLATLEVERIEQYYNILLPDDYRAFLTILGNGGAGPGYGLQRFGFVRSVVDIPTATARGPMRPIQVTRRVTISRQDLFDAAGNKVDPFEIDYFDEIRALARDTSDNAEAPSKPFPLAAPFRKWEHKSAPALSQIKPATGTWMLAHYGCAMTAHLVLNGPFRGQVWFCDPNDQSFVPFGEKAHIHYCDAEEPVAEDASTVFTFCSWYEHWLDHALQLVEGEYHDRA